METLNYLPQIIMNIIHFLITAAVIICSISGLIMFFWILLWKQRDYTYQKTAKSGTPCRYWDHEILCKGRIESINNGMATIKDFLTAEITERPFSETEAL
jgi:nitrogen fixation-related uncharacterized protein